MMAMAILLVIGYSYLVLGSFSPIHFRSQLAMVGIFCVILSTAAGFSTAFAIGVKIS